MDSTNNNREKRTPPPTKTIVNKVLHHFNCDSPFRMWPKYSTPPSQARKMKNPFESHLLERLSFNTFSPTVFAHVSTPKNNETNEFRWSIDEISSLKPVEIEATLEQHLSEHEVAAMDPLVQEKINHFFNTKVVVPSPLGISINKTISMVPPSPENDDEKQEELESKPEMTDESVQTVLTLPPILPKHVEEILAPYFSYNKNQQKFEGSDSYYKRLFNIDDDDEDELNEINNSTHTSPAQSTGLSPLQFSPVTLKPLSNLNSSDIPEFKDCTLSPISNKSIDHKTDCNISHMTIDASCLVPNLSNNDNDNQRKTLSDCSFASVDMSLKDNCNWDLEYDEDSFTKCTTNDDLLNTPHSKMFTSQRKRLSDSFKDVEMKEASFRKIVKNKLFSDTANNDDMGYQTGSTFDSRSDCVSRMSTSTPTKDY